MKRSLRLLRFPALLTLAFLVALALLPGRTGVAVRIFVLLLAAYALAQLLALLRASLPERAASPLEEALTPRGRPRDRVPELERIEREVALGLATAFDLHFRLRPTLRRIAAELLWARRGVDLDQNPDTARRALGEETWELVREDREPPPERFAPGIELAVLRRVVTSLEAL